MTTRLATAISWQFANRRLFVDPIVWITVFETGKVRIRISLYSFSTYMFYLVPIDYIVNTCHSSFPCIRDSSSAARNRDNRSSRTVLLEIGTLPMATVPYIFPLLLLDIKQQTICNTHGMISIAHWWLGVR